MHVNILFPFSLVEKTRQNTQKREKKERKKVEKTATESDGHSYKYTYSNTLTLKLNFLSFYLTVLFNQTPYSSFVFLYFYYDCYVVCIWMMMIIANEWIDFQHVNEWL